MFGTEPRVGLSTTSLPPEIINDIQDEDDLRRFIEDNEEIDLTKDNDKSDYDNISGNGDDDESSSVENKIEKARKMAAENLKKQTKKMKSISDKLHPPAKVGDNVTIPIPDVDRGKGDLRNVIGVVLQTNDESLYKIDTKHGVLQKLYCRTEFDVCTQKFLQEEEVRKKIEILLRTAATKHLVGTGQGFVRCSCTKNCSTNKCQCKKK